MSTIVAAFPLFAARRACRYQAAIYSRAIVSRAPVTHSVTMGATVYTINANTGKIYRGATK